MDVGVVEQADVVGAADVEQVGAREELGAAATVPPVRRARPDKDVTAQVADRVPLLAGQGRGHQVVRIGVAAQVAATICGVKVGPVAVLGTAVDASGTTSTVCTTDQDQPVTITQN